MTEVVHCKSKSEVGVRDAAAECAARWLPQVLGASGAKLIVGLGTIARTALEEHLQARGSQVVEREGRVFAFLPHPNARVRRRFQDVLDESHLEVVRARLRA